MPDTVSAAKARVQIKKTVRDMLRAILSGLLAVTDFVTRLFNHIVPAPSEGGKQGIPTNIAVGLAVLIPVVIVIVVVGLALSKQGQTDFEVYLAARQIRPPRGDDPLRRQV